MPIRPGAATVRERADVSIFASARMLTHGGSGTALSGHARTSAGDVETTLDTARLEARATFSLRPTNSKDKGCHARTSVSTETAAVTST